jgi:hypothetical protein
MGAFALILIAWLGACTPPEKRPSTIADTGTGPDTGSDPDLDADDTALPIDADADGFDETVDCDDTDAAIHPGVTDICDGLDNDCDTQIDEDPDRIFYLDADVDGFGDPLHPLSSCTGHPSFVENAADCDDDNASIYPGAPDVCDDRDNDCDGTIDDEEICQLCMGTSVLIYALMTESALVDGVTALGASVLTVDNAASFVEAIAAESPDVVIFSSPASGYETALATALSQQIAAGRGAIVSYWDYTSATALTDALEVSVDEELSRPYTLYGAVPPLFTHPNLMADPWFHDGVDAHWTIDGVTWMAESRVEVLATIDAETTKPTIVRSAGGRAIANGFLFDNFRFHDADADGIPDLSEIIGNQVALISGCAD